MDAALEWLRNADDVMILGAYAVIVLMACVPIYIGAHRSLDQKMVETLSSSDAYMFPVIGSCVLFGLFILFKYLSKEYVNMLLTLYFLGFGIMAVSSTLRPYVGALLGENKKTRPYEFSVTFPWDSTPTVVRWTWYGVISFFIGACIGIWYVLTKHWAANNIIGLSFSIQGVGYLALPNYQVGCILLGGLFFYDIFWVFGTDVMVTVAKSFDAPIKVLFPKNLFAAEFEFSMLGLGDIVIPGIFIALMLRFDAKRARGHAEFKKPYFTFTWGAYILGMLSTIFVMHTFHAAQPALLYLVPACIGSSLFVAVLLGELGDLIAYDESEGRKKKKMKSKTPTAAANKKKPATKAS